MAYKTTAERRTARVRRHIKSVANGRPRLSIYRSSQQIYAQILDDVKGVTLASASTIEKDLRAKLKTGADVNAASEIGKLVAERAKKAGVTTVVFVTRSVSISLLLVALLDLLGVLLFFDFQRISVTCLIACVTSFSSLGLRVMKYLIQSSD